MNRIEKRLEELKQENKKSIYYIYNGRTAGFTDHGKTDFCTGRSGCGYFRNRRAVFRPGSRRPGDSECLLSGNPERHNAYKDF